MMLKKILAIFLLLYYQNIVVAGEKKLITINQFLTHAALDQARAGIEHALNNRLSSKFIEIKMNNAQGNIASAVQIAQYHASLKPDVMIGVATPSAQANLRVLDDNSIMAFIAVTKPDLIGLINADNVIGVSDMPPIRELMKITQTLIKLRVIGVIFNPGESNSVETVKIIQEVANELGIVVKQSTISSSRDVKLAMQKLVGQVDLIYLPQDNVVVSAVDSILQIANKAKTPVVANDPSLVKKGLLLAFGCDYFASGKQLGNMIADLLNGQKLLEKIQPAIINQLKINHQIAEKLGINIPQQLRLQESL